MIYDLFLSSYFLLYDEIALTGFTYTAVGLALLSSLLDGAIRVGLALTSSSAWVSLQQHLVSMKANEKISLLT